MEKITLTLGNKRLDKKPETPLEKSNYFKDLTFHTRTFTPQTFKEVIENGYTITYVYKDDDFTRKEGYMKNNYLGTQFIVVDIDTCDIPPSEFISRIKYKPTIYHTTFSNLTEKKDYKYCFHLIYLFDEMIYGEDNFHSTFDRLTNDYKEYVDKCCLDCHRVMFTSNSSLSSYEYKDYDITYKVSDFIDDNKRRYNNLDEFFKEQNNKEKWEKRGCLNNNHTLSNLSREHKISQYKNEEEKPKDNTFHLEDEFFKDLYSMKRKEFVEKYSLIYPYITETLIPKEEYENGYVDLRDVDYYKIPTSQIIYDSETNTYHTPRVKIGVRNKWLWVDTLVFLKIFPDITKEHLVFLLVKEVYKHFDNSDREMTNDVIIDKVRKIWNKKDDIDITPTKKTFKIDNDYWRERGVNDWLEVIRNVRKEMKSNDFGELYDLKLSIEENLIILKKFGINTTKRTLLKWLNENNVPYFTQRRKRDVLVLQVYVDDPNRSSRKIEKICSEKGIKVSYKTIQSIIKNYNVSYPNDGDYTCSRGD